MIFLSRICRLNCNISCSCLYLDRRKVPHLFVQCKIWQGKAFQFGIDVRLVSNCFSIVQ
jgi:hypothetical protein